MFSFLRALFAATTSLWGIFNLIAKWVNERREARRLEQLAKDFDKAVIVAKETKDTSEIDKLFDGKGGLNGL